MEVLNSKGQPVVYVPAETYAAIDWDAIFAWLGAFPLAGGKDAFNAASFPPGKLHCDDLRRVWARGYWCCLSYTLFLVRTCLGP